MIKLAVSKAIVPLLVGEAAASIQKTLETAKIKPYSKSESDTTTKAVELALSKRNIDSIGFYRKGEVQLWANI